MAVTTSDDDGFREIQLNGKQLVFLFMAVTVVLVVTFLTGVLVGRGVRAERAEAAQADAVSEAPPTPARATEPAPVSEANDPTKATPPAGDLEEAPEPPVAAPRNPEIEPKSAPAPVRAAAEPAKKPAPAAPQRNAAADGAATTTTVKSSTPPAAATTAAAIPSAPPDGPRSGYAVQVAAVNVRGDADAIVRRLSGKGYPAYVEVPKNTASVFRVRVGTFRTRREAQTVADRLKKEEKFNPWVTR